MEWSNSSEFVLMTGGCDGAIRFWDIRRAGSFLVLDQSLSQLGRRPPLLPKPSNEVCLLPVLFPTIEDYNGSLALVVSVLLLAESIEGLDFRVKKESRYQHYLSVLIK